MSRPFQPETNLEPVFRFGQTGMSVLLKLAVGQTFLSVLFEGKCETCNFLHNEYRNSPTRSVSEGEPLTDFGLSLAVPQTPEGSLHVQD